jgi:hypothetical protein
MVAKNLDVEVYPIVVFDLIDGPTEWLKDRPHLGLAQGIRDVLWRPFHERM